MKIRKFNSIKGYKSFSDFSWSKFCKKQDKQGNCSESHMSHFSTFFGENGSGKSSMCDVLKSLSNNQDFPNTPPTLAEIELNDATDQIYKYENGKWSSQINKNSFLFFDVDFINANVHTHGVRSSNLQQGAHTQKAGKLIIDLDEQANKLKEAVKVRKDELEAFQVSNAIVLGQQFTDREKEFFITYKDADDKTKKDSLSKTQEELKKLEGDLTTLQKLNSKYQEVNRLSTVGDVTLKTSLSSKEVITKLFSRQIKEKAQDEADETIKAHFSKHKQFIEYAKEQIPQNYKDENCPLCMQPLVKATKVIEYYRTVFDQTYEKAKRQFLSDIETEKSKLEAIKSNISSLSSKVSAVFDAFEKIKNDFEIKNIYKLEEKTKHTDLFIGITTKEIDDLLAALESLKKIEREQIDVGKLYDAVANKIHEIDISIKALSTLIAEKNKLISSFKNKYSDQSKITCELEQKNIKQTELNELIDFLKNNKAKQLNDQNAVLDKQKTFSEALKNAQDELKTYLANTIPASVISQMITILGKFNLNFTLEHITTNTNTKDYSFSFNIKDQKGNERQMKDGLSEGERQLISLAFFFAINENLKNKDKTVLIFDDPITSLDAPNLKILAELIHTQIPIYSQVIVFTHHPLFHKYIVKPDTQDKTNFGVLKNADIFGGSFVFCDSNYDMVEEVKQCNQEIASKATSGTLQLEEISLKYGQLLRLAIEKFIKHELLMWNKESDFGSQIVNNLKSSRSKISQLGESDLDTLTNIYNYCNQSNLLHVDKENPSALSELTNNIDRFVTILDKSRN